MKTRIAYVSYNSAEVTQFKVKSSKDTTNLYYGDTYTPDFKGRLLAEIRDADKGSGDIEITVEDGPINDLRKSTIRLTCLEAEAVLTALLARQRLHAGYELQLYKKD